MTDEDMCSRAAELFYQHIEDQTKINKDFVIEDIAAFAYEWARYCNFEHPRCFVKYIEDIENEKIINNLTSKNLGDSNESSMPGK